MSNDNTAPDGDRKRKSESNPSSSLSSSYLAPELRRLRPNEAPAEGDSEVGDEAASDDSEGELVMDEWTVKALDCVCIKTVRTAGDLDDNATTFHPEMMHQMLGRHEVLRGYKQPRIDVYFVADSLYAYVGFAYGDKRAALPSSSSSSSSAAAPDAAAESEQQALERARFVRDGVTDLPALMRYWMPDDAANYTFQLDDFRRHIGDAFAPPGECVHRHTTAKGRSFEIYRGTFADDAIRNFYQRLRIFSMWFIDGARYLDDDPKWEIYLIFERAATGRIWCGFASCYPFYAFPDKVRLRISQAMVTPAYQGQSLGRTLLLAIYGDALARPEVRDITVEDPAPAFVRLRDLVDLRRIGDLSLFAGKPLQPLDAATRTAVAAQLKMYKHQVQRCWEIHWLLQLRTAPTTDYPAVNAWRIAVKKRLFKQTILQLRGRPVSEQEDATRRSLVLSRLQQLETEYNDVIGRVQAPGDGTR